MSAASDPDGDGWGWENQMSCRVVQDPVIDPVTGIPDCVSAASDPDGDGWGWENEKSCKVVTAPNGLVLSNPNASKEAVELYNYLNQNYGKKTLTGQQESTWLSGGARHELNFIQAASGKLPAILGLDYIDPNDYAGVNSRAAKWYKTEGGIPTICWHWGAPTIGTGYENSKKYFDLPKALIDGTTENRAMMRDMDIIAAQLTVLRDQNVPVLWRPMHEFTGTWFWWGMHGDQNFKKLWIKMYDYFTKVKGLNNLIWVLGYSGEPKASYYPGRQYVDIAGPDTYANNNGSLKSHYELVRKIVGDKMPIALHENGPIPDPVKVQADGANWIYFMTWHSDFVTNNPINTSGWFNTTYNSDRYITKDELPKWGTTNNNSNTAALFAAGQAVRIMPLGDSITGSPGCWRAYLWNGLVAAGAKNIDFVGTLNAQQCGQQHDADNEGHGGFTVTDIARNTLLPAWLNTANPNVVLMHLGTNDVWGNKSTNDILSAYTTLIGQMRAKNSRMVIMVAQLIPMTPRGDFTCTTCYNGVVALNAAIVNWAKSNSTANSPIIVVDQWTGFNVTTDTSDGVHPVDSGNRKIAANWQKALLAILPK